MAAKSEAPALSKGTLAARFTPLATKWKIDVGDLLTIRNHACPNAPPEELNYYMHRCRMLGADPFGRMLLLIPRNAKRPSGDGKGWEYYIQWTEQTTIDGFRSFAEGSDDKPSGYEGQEGPYYCGEDGVWSDVWLLDDPPVAAKVGIFRAGFRQPLYRVARYSEYVETNKEGPVRLWKTMPALMTAKCAEALALRAAFPRKLAGLYTMDEMMQARREQGEGIDPAPDGTPRLVSVAGQEPVPTANEITKLYGEVFPDATLKAGRWLIDEGIAPELASRKPPILTDDEARHAKRRLLEIRNGTTDAPPQEVLEPAEVLEQHLAQVAEAFGATSANRDLAQQALAEMQKPPCPACFRPDGHTDGCPENPNPPKAQTNEKPESNGTKMSTTAQQRQVHTIQGKIGKLDPTWKDDATLYDYARSMFARELEDPDALDSTSLLTRVQASALIDDLNKLHGSMLQKQNAMPL